MFRQASIWHNGVLLRQLARHRDNGQTSRRSCYDGAVTDKPIAPAIMTRESRDFTWVINPDASTDQIATLMRGIDRAHADTRSMDARVTHLYVGAQLVFGGALFNVGSNIAAPMRVCAAVMFALGLIVILTAPKALRGGSRYTPDSTVALPLNYLDVYWPSDAARAAVEDHGFGSPAHRALWRVLQSRDAKRALDELVREWEDSNVKESVSRAGRLRARELSRDMQCAWIEFKQLAVDASATAKAESSLLEFDRTRG